MTKHDPWQIVRDFERAVADFAGSKFAVAVDTCTWALFLSLKWHQQKYKLTKYVTLPAYTYLGVPQYVVHAGMKPIFEHRDWSGEYNLAPFPIIDSACRFKQGMHVRNTFRCVSFNARKHLPILCGRGGMILHDDPKADLWLRRARYLGQDELTVEERAPYFVGWHCFMEPARAADGLQRLSLLANNSPDDLRFVYPDCSVFDYSARL